MSIYTIYEIYDSARSHLVQRTAGYEVFDWFDRLREEKAVSIYQVNMSKQSALSGYSNWRFPVYRQVEFDRDLLLGPKNAQVLKQPGKGWVTHDEAHVESVAARLTYAAEILRGNA